MTQADGDVEDVELVLLDQVEQQVERALEGRQRDDVTTPFFSAHRVGPTWERRSGPSETSQYRRS